MSNGKKSYGQIIILIVVVSLFFIPNSAFASGYYPPDPILVLLLLITIVVFPIALVYLGIILLRSFKPILGNYIHSNRFIVIGLYFLAEGISWGFYRVLISILSSTSIHFGEMWTDFLILIVIPGILLISIGGTLIIKHYNDDKKLENS